MHSLTIFGSVEGLIHDPQHRPVKGAQVTIHAVSSEWRQIITSDDSGEFRFDTVPVGEYMVMVETSGFASQQQNVVITSGRDAKLHFALTLRKPKKQYRSQKLRPL